MKIIIIYFTVFAALLLKTYAQNPKYFTLTGSIHGQSTGKLFLLYYNKTNKIIDSTDIKDGKFSFSGLIDEPTKAGLSDNKKMREGNENYYPDFYIEPSPMFISLVNNHFAEAKLSGSKTNDEFQILNTHVNPVFEKIAQLQGEIKTDSRKNNSLADSLLLYNKKAKDILFAFIKSFPNSYIAVDAINRLSNFKEIGADSVIVLLNSLNPAITNTFTAQKLRQAFVNKVNSTIGHQASDFTRKDINGKIISLSSFRGNYVLLDYWASWCLYCRELTPHLKILYEKYHSKGLTIIAISCDSKYSDWLGAVKKDRVKSFVNILSFSDNDMNFLKTHDNVGEASWEGELRKQFNLMPIPVEILISKEGLIIGRYRGPGDQSVDMLDNKLSEIFEKD